MMELLKKGFMEKEKWRKWLSLTLAIVIALCSVSIPKTEVQAAGATYNVDAAIAYAEAHWNDGQGLCAEFVSKCVQAGGILIPTKTITSDCFNAVSNATGISGQWLTLTSGGYALQSQNASKLSRGDIVISWCDNGHTYRPHIMLCGGYDSDGYATFYAHNYPHHNDRIPASSGTCGICGRSNGQLKAQVLHISSLNYLGAPVDLGNEFYAEIIAACANKPLTNMGGDGRANNVAIKASQSNLDAVRYQIWQFKKQSNGSYGIFNVANGKALDVDGASSSSGTNVQVYPWWGGAAQQWTIYRDPKNSAYYKLTAGCTDCFLDVYGFQTADGTNVQMYGYNTSSAQQFIIRKISAPGRSQMSVSPGNSASPTVLRWTAASSTDIYNIRINGTVKKDIWNYTGTSYSITLPAGNYEVYVDACNKYLYQASNKVSFTVAAAPAPVKVNRITLNKTSSKLFLGKTTTINATVSPSNANNKGVKWTSSNSKVATVDSKGVVTAKGVGTATITCTAKDGSNVKATCKITVSRPVTKITLNKTKANIKKGKKLTLRASVSPFFATNKNVTWKSSNPSVATVNSKGVVTAKKAGTVTITCTAADGSKVKATCKITVKK